MLNNLYYAVRALVKNPGFVVFAACILVIGIGEDSALLSLVNRTLHPSPVLKLHREASDITKPVPRLVSSIQRAISKAADPITSDLVALVPQITCELHRLAAEMFAAAPQSIRVSLDHYVFTPIRQSTTFADCSTVKPTHKRVIVVQRCDEIVIRIECPAYGNSVSSPTSNPRAAGSWF